MNVPRSVLRRRRFIESSAVLALGTVGSLLAGRKLIDLPTRKPKSDPVVAVPKRQPPAPPATPEPPEMFGPPAAAATPPRPLSYEEEYAQFLISLDLRHISPHEIIDPHRGVMNGVENSLPPKHLWEKLAPTLKVADELRERLELPLCRVSSAYRCPKYNAVIPGAVSRSYHTRNQALDLIYHCSTRKVYQAAVQLRREGFFRGGIGLYPTFIHIDTRGYAATWRRV